jgi:hypothetical protein
MSGSAVGIAGWSGRLGRSRRTACAPTRRDGVRLGGGTPAAPGAAVKFLLHSAAAGVVCVPD